jgi:hypothetical protein
MKPSGAPGFCSSRAGAPTKALYLGDLLGRALIAMQHGCIAPLFDFTIDAFAQPRAPSTRSKMLSTLDLSEAYDPQFQTVSGTVKASGGYL